MSKNNEIKKPIKQSSELISLLTEISKSLTDIKDLLYDNNYLLDALTFGGEEDPTVATKKDYGIELNSSAITGTFLPDDSDEDFIIKYTPKDKK